MKYTGANEIHRRRLYINIMQVMHGYDIAAAAQILSMPLKMSIDSKSTC